MLYYRRPWDESRGGAQDAWGAATYYFETGSDGVVSRQVEVYADGHVLRYDRSYSEDAYGLLAEKRLDAAEFEPYRVSEADFAAVWPAGKAPGPELSEPNDQG